MNLPNTKVANTSEELYDYLHDLSMDRDPPTALYGRGLKLFIPVLDQWQRAEAERRTDNRDLLIATVKIAAQLLSLSAQNCSKPGHCAPVLAKLNEATIAILHDHYQCAVQADKLNTVEELDVQEVLNLLNKLFNKPLEQEGTGE